MFCCGVRVCRSFRFFAAAILATLLIPAALSAEFAPFGSAASSANPAGFASRDRVWDVSFYHGVFTNTTLGETVLFARTDYQPAYLTALTVARPTRYDLLDIPLEAEAQLVRHSGAQKHLEFNGVLVARYEFPRAGASLAVGEGLSFATRRPDVEIVRPSASNPLQDAQATRNLLNYLMFEAEFRAPIDAENSRVFMRIHHRSGIWGVFCPRTCGSNFVTYGVRFSF